MTKHTLGDLPIEPAYYDQMNALARLLDDTFNGDLRGKDREVGFCLIVFNFDGGGRANYISNADRTDVMTLLREQLARFEGQAEMRGQA